MPVRSKDLAEAVINIVETAKSRKQAAQAVAAYLVAERQTKNLHGLVRLMEELQLERHGKMEVTAETARPLSEASKKHIRQLFDAKDVLVHEEIDKTILGGVRVRALDKVADFSVQARLRQLKQGRNIS